MLANRAFTCLVILRRRSVVGYSRERVLKCMPNVQRPHKQISCLFHSGNSLSFFLSIYGFSQAWKEIRTSSFFCQGETSSRFAPHPGRKPASTNYKKTAEPCGTNRKRLLSRIRPVSGAAAPAFHLHVCDHRKVNSLPNNTKWCCGGSGLTFHIAVFPIEYR